MLGTKLVCIETCSLMETRMRDSGFHPKPIHQAFCAEMSVGQRLFCRHKARASEIVVWLPCSLCSNDATIRGDFAMRPCADAKVITKLPIVEIVLRFFTRLRIG